MRISIEKLTVEAQKTGFRAEILEKVARLTGLLNSLGSHPFLREKIVLKGGTALNLFILDVPRLSVDIDLNCIGAHSKESMMEERPKIEKAAQAVFSREGFMIRHIPKEHAGGKWLLRYQSAFGQTGNLEVDMNFMFRIPLWPVKAMDSHPLGPWKATAIPVMDFNELAAGKIVALFSRGQARDLFDCHQIFYKCDPDYQKLRLAFVVYGAMNRKDWRTVSLNEVNFNAAELTRQLVPTLRHQSIWTKRNSEEHGKRLVEECRQALSVLLPFNDDEVEFLDRILDKGEINPFLLSMDNQLCERIRRQPLLEWKALNVRKHKGLS